MAEENLENEKNEKEIAEEQETVNSDVEQGAEVETPKELSPDEKYSELNDRFLRLFAEFDNYRKRSNKEKIDLIATANSGILKDLLPVVDDFERAISNNQNVSDADAIKEGVQIIYNKLKSILDSKGLKAMESKGQPFDSELHEAIANVPVETENEKGIVIDDVEKGYYLNDKVIRYAKVVVGQ
jgi:molecular chaperone GrpE